MPILIEGTICNLMLILFLDAVGSSGLDNTMQAIVIGVVTGGLVVIIMVVVVVVVFARRNKQNSKQDKGVYIFKY